LGTRVNRWDVTVAAKVQFVSPFGQKFSRLLGGKAANTPLPSSSSFGFICRIQAYLAAFFISCDTSFFNSALSLFESILLTVFFTMISNGLTALP